MYSLNQELPRNPPTGKKPQWDSVCLTHTDQSFQPTTQLQPDGLKADYAFKLSDHAYFTSI